MKNVTLVGAGPVGSLLSIFLAKRGFDVEIHERRPDMRKEQMAAGRSINLAVSARGFHALGQVGLKDEVLGQAIPMKGRMIHSLKGELTFQRYGRDDSECIYSVSRAGLNRMLMTHAENTGKVRIHFHSKVDGHDFESRFPVVIGTDGSASSIRQAFTERPGFSQSETELDYGYKELLIPAGSGPDRIFQLEKNALHIWPRGTFMLIALPNFDGSFTCTLFLPLKGYESFESLHSAEEVSRFFETYFSDARPLFSELESSFFENPTGHMVTVKCSPWQMAGRALLLGDAAHAIVPFFGQGMNAGFEDCSLLDELMAKNPQATWSTLFTEFSRARKPDADAIADMALENFLEMRDKVGQPSFLFQKKTEKILQDHFPGEYISRYSLVSFSRVPYRVALRAGVIEEEILAEICHGLSNPAEVDLKRAGELIRTKLTPYLAPYMKG